MSNYVRSIISYYLDFPSLLLYNVVTGYKYHGMVYIPAKLLIRHTFDA